MKRIIALLIVTALAVFIAGCSKGNQESGMIEMLVPSASFSDGETESNSPFESDVTITESDSGDIKTGISQTESKNSVVSNSTGNNSSVTSRPSDTPANNTQSQQPTNSTPPNPPPTESSTPTTEPPPVKPTYTEADFQKIINEIRAYGESKGFIWKKSFAFEQDLQYYGRPNIERDGYDRVIETLKYHCDRIETQYGICHFKVIKYLYQGNTEFIVLYD